MESQNLAALLDMYEQREQYVQDLKNIDKRFAPTLELVMADSGFERIEVDNNTFFRKEYVEKNHDNAAIVYQGWYVLESRLDNASLWKVEREQWSEFARYLSKREKEYSGFGKAGLYIGVLSGFTLGASFTAQTAIQTSNLYIGLPVGVGLGLMTTFVQTFALALLGLMIDNQREKKAEERRQKYEPIATSKEALEKVAELYDSS